MEVWRPAKYVFTSLEKKKHAYWFSISCSTFCTLFWRYRLWKERALSFFTVIAIIVISSVPRARVCMCVEENCRGGRVGTGQAVCGVGGGERTGQAFPQENISPSATIEPVRKQRAATLFSGVTDYFQTLISLSHTHAHTLERCSLTHNTHSRMTNWSSASQVRQVGYELRVWYYSYANMLVNLLMN